MKYSKVKDLKDVTMVYSDCQDYDVRVWDPVLQRKGTIYFTGSSNPEKYVSFNVTFEDQAKHQKNILDAFDNVLKEIIDSKYDMGLDWKSKFIQELHSIINKKEEQ